MREAQKLNLVLGRMDFLVAPFEVGLDHEGGRVACFGGGGVVGAGVAAFRKDVGDVAVLEQREVRPGCEADRRGAYPDIPL